MPKTPSCVSCSGTGELPTDHGLIDCPDCGGAGFLPSKNVLIDWRARDLERNLERGSAPSAQDARWLLSELRNARTALTEVIALAHDLGETDQALAFRIRMAASSALGLYELAASAHASASPAE